jgi:hypothetical protein
MAVWKRQKPLPTVSSNKRLELTAGKRWGAAA